MNLRTWLKMSQVFVFSGYFLALSPLNALGAASSQFRFQSHTWSPPAGECGLARFSLGELTLHEKNFSKAEHTAVYSKRIAAVIETNQPDCIANYGVVQWIRGCIVNTYQFLDTKRINQTLGTSRQHRGQSIPFVHKNWSIDSTELDPLYWSSPVSNPSASARLDHYLSPKQPLLTHHTAQAAQSITPFILNLESKRPFTNFRNLVQPTQQSVVVDAPTGSLFMHHPTDPDTKDILSYSTTSLEFKICVYRLSDVPLQGDPARFDVPQDQGGPIHCFDWDSKARWNDRLKTFEPFTEMDPYCSVEPE